MWDDADFFSDEPLVRHNAHQAAKGRAPLPDPDMLRDRARTAENSASRAWAAVRVRNEEVARLSDDARLLASALHLLAPANEWMLAPDLAAAIERHRP